MAWQRRRNLVGEQRHSELFVDHQGEDAHLGGTALVEFNSTLLHLRFGIERVPSVVNVSVAVITNEFAGAVDILHDVGLQETNEEEHLAKSGGRDFGQGRKAVGNVGKGLARVVNVARQTDAGFLDEVSDHGEHANASVLDLHITQAVELFLVTVRNKSKRIKETQRGLRSELVRERLQRRGRSLLGSGGEG
jgi:hypothetical protein